MTAEEEGMEQGQWPKMRERSQSALLDAKLAKVREVGQRVRLEALDFVAIEHLHERARACIHQRAFMWHTNER